MFVYKISKINFLAQKHYKNVNSNRIIKRFRVTHVQLIILGNRVINKKCFL